MRVWQQFGIEMGRRWDTDRLRRYPRKEDVEYAQTHTQHHFMVLTALGYDCLKAKWTERDQAAKAKLDSQRWWVFDRFVEDVLILLGKNMEHNWRKIGIGQNDGMKMGQNHNRREGAHITMVWRPQEGIM